MSEFPDAAILSALRRQMTNAVQRQAVAASNLANLDTPGYRTREMAFNDALDAELGSDRLVRTNERHLAEPTRDAAGLPREVDGLAARRDGNNVHLDRELVSLTRASGDFTAAQTALAAKFRLIRYAINEGR